MHAQQSTHALVPSGTTLMIAQFFPFFSSLPACPLVVSQILCLPLYVCTYLNPIRTYLCVVPYPLQVLCKSTICSCSHRSRYYQCDVKFGRSLSMLVLSQAVLSVLYGVWQEPDSLKATPRYKQSVMLFNPCRIS